MNKYLNHTPLGLAILASSIVIAQSPAQAAEEDSVWDPVIVSANRLPQTADEALSSVTVITQEDIAQRQYRSLVQALQNEAGISVATNGGVGKTSSLFLRGTESDHTLVLLDGIRVGSASLGTFAWQDMPVDLIDRIEIVRGPRSSLYGSDAIGGVIQIFTRKGHSEKTRITASVGAGNNQTREASMSLSGGAGGLYSRIGVNYEETEGENSCREDAGVLFGGCFTTEPDDDGYERLAAQLAVGYRFKPGNYVELQGLYSENENEFDGGFENESDGQQNQVSVTAALTPADIWSVRLVAGRSEDKIDSAKDGVFASRFNTLKDTVSWINGLVLGENVTLSLGSDYLREELTSSTEFTEEERETLAGFAQLGVQWGILSTELSGRYDDTDGQYGRWTGSFGAGLALSESTQLFTSVGNAYKVPSFNDLYFPGFGNPDLEPEESISTEIGLRHQLESWQFSVTGYRTEIEDLIAFDPVLFIPVNVDEARIKGVEFSVDYRDSDWVAGADLDWMQTENVKGNNAGNELPRRPQRKLSLYADRSFARWSIGGELLFVGKTYDDLANNRELGAWQTLALRASVDLTKNLVLKARVDNVFDKQYETASFYLEPDRSFLLSLHYDTGA